MNDTVYGLRADAAGRAPGAAAVTFLPSPETEPHRLTYGAYLARRDLRSRWTWNVFWTAV